MGFGEFTKSGAFVAIVFALVIVLVPFGLEQIGEATDLFRFPATKTIKGWFLKPKTSGGVVARSVDWERYRQDLETFSQWAEEQSCVGISLPLEPDVIRVVVDKKVPVRQIWPVSVVGCTASDPVNQRKGYIFISGCDGPFEEGTVIAPTTTLCGYEIVFIGERSVWFRVIREKEEKVPLGIVKFPEFTRLEGESLVWGSRRYVVRDAFALASGGWLMVDSFLPPDGTVFKILNENRREVMSLLCVVLGEKGGR